MRYVLLFSLLLAIIFSSNAYSKESENFSGPATIPPPDETFYEILDFEKIVDGDTFKASGRTIRIWGINTPRRKISRFMTYPQWL